MYRSKDSFAGQSYYAGEAQRREHTTAASRGEGAAAFLVIFNTFPLRLGFLLQLAAIATGTLFTLTREGGLSYSFDLFGVPQDIKQRQTFNVALLLCDILYLIGAISILTFQVYLPDNGERSRGFRTGSKMLSTAAMTDVFVAALRLTQHAYALNWLARRWWSRNVASSSDWIAWHTSAGIHASSLVLYGLSIYFMEHYNDEGTDQESLVCICVLLYLIGGVLEFSLTFINWGGFFILPNLFAVCAALCWASTFESTIMRMAPRAHQPHFGEKAL